SWRTDSIDWKTTCGNCKTKNNPKIRSMIKEFIFYARHEKEADQTIKKISKNLRKALREEYKAFTERKAKIEGYLKGVKDHGNE
ncbi:MAG: hypothetical protein E6Z15_00490, partial [Paenibacillus macerans]|nr:hypothetical protein [Paenibacillus macerans]